MRRGIQHRERSRRVIVLLVVACLAAPALAAPAGWMLVIEGARAADGTFVQRDHDHLARTALLWPEGVVAAPAGLAWRDTGVADLAIALDAASLQISATAGRLPLDPGNYDIDTPLTIDDGRVVALLADGRLVVERGGLRYGRTPPAGDGGRGGTLLLVAGLGLATAVLLRLARRRAPSS
ncbi:hypothetical protein GF314_11215 [bacterium]|nr:hypothetical protein [bacterium]